MKRNPHSDRWRRRQNRTLLADAALPESDVSIVIMDALPVAAYKGDVVGLAATKPAAGQKLQAGSAAAVQYAQFLQQAQDAVLNAAGVDAGQVVYRYTYALNGFAARLTPEQIREIKEQSGVALVLRDEFRYAWKTKRSTKKRRKMPSSAPSLEARRAWPGHQRRRRRVRRHRHRHLA